MAPSLQTKFDMPALRLRQSSRGWTQALQSSHAVHNSLPSGLKEDPRKGFLCSNFRTNSPLDASKTRATPSV